MTTTAARPVPAANHLAVTCSACDHVENRADDFVTNLNAMWSHVNAEHAAPYAIVDTDTDANGHPVWVATIHRPGRKRRESITAASAAVLAARLRHRGVDDVRPAR